MYPSLKEYKRTIRAFLREHYTDARLVELLQHARGGNLAFFSCCCFIGTATADHELRGATTPVGEPHYLLAKSLPGAEDAEIAYAGLRCEPSPGNRPGYDYDARGRRRLIPIILAEMRRRSLARDAVAREATVMQTAR